MTPQPKMSLSRFTIQCAFFTFLVVSFLPFPWKGLNTVKNGNLYGCSTFWGAMMDEAYLLTGDREDLHQLCLDDLLIHNLLMMTVILFVGTIIGLLIYRRADEVR